MVTESAILSGALVRITISICHLSVLSILKSISCRRTFRPSFCYNVNHKRFLAYLTVNTKILQSLGNTAKSSAKIEMQEDI